MHGLIGKTSGSMESLCVDVHDSLVVIIICYLHPTIEESSMSSGPALDYYEVNMGNAHEIDECLGRGPLSGPGVEILVLSHV